MVWKHDRLLSRTIPLAFLPHRHHTVLSCFMNRILEIGEIQMRVSKLERVVTEMKFRLERMEENTDVNVGSLSLPPINPLWCRWGVIYSRRVAILANVLVGLWRFWEKFLELLSENRKVIMQSLFQRLDPSTLPLTMQEK